MSNSLSLYMSASCTLISSKLQKVETFCFVVGTSSDRVVMEFLLRFKMIETQRGHRLSQTQYNCSSKKEFLLMSMVLFVAVHNHYKRIYKPIRRLGARPRRCRRRGFFDGPVLPPGDAQHVLGDGPVGVEGGMRHAPEYSISCWASLAWQQGPQEQVYRSNEWYRDGPPNHCWRLHRLLLFCAWWQELRVYLLSVADFSQSKLVIHFLRQWASLKFEESINQMRLHWDLKKVLGSGYFLKRQSEPNLIREQ